MSTKNELVALDNGVTVKVSDSGKCISVYGIISDRQPVNFTVEMWDKLQANIHALAGFVDNNRDKLLSREERKFAKQADKQSDKIAKEAATLVQKQKAIQLMREHKGLDFDSAMQLAATPEVKTA